LKLCCSSRGHAGVDAAGVDAEARTATLHPASARADCKKARRARGTEGEWGVGTGVHNFGASGWVMSAGFG